MYPERFLITPISRKLTADYSLSQNIRYVYESKRSNTTQGMSKNAGVMVQSSPTTSVGAVGLSIKGAGVGALTSSVSASDPSVVPLLLPRVFR